MRIALVTHSRPGNHHAGVEIYLSRLVDSLVDCGHEISVLCPTYSPLAPNGEIKVAREREAHFFEVNIHLDGNFESRYNNPRIGDCFSKVLEIIKADIIHFHHLLGFTGAAVVSCRNHGLPMVITVHDAWLLCDQANLLRPDGNACQEGPTKDELCVACLFHRRPEMASVYDYVYATRLVKRRRIFLKRAAEECDLILAPSLFMKNLLTRHEYDELKIQHSPLGLYCFSRSNESQRATSSDRLRFGYFGNISPVKGLDVLLKAVLDIDPNKFQLDIYGGVHSAGLAEKLFSKISCYSNINVHGEYVNNDIINLLSKIDVVIVPSRMESYCFVARECLQQGVPVIASSSGALSELIQEGVNGWLFPQNSAAELRKILLHIIEHPHELKNLKPRETAIESTHNEVVRLNAYYNLLHRKHTRHP